MAESPILIYSGVVLDLKLSDINKVVVENHLGGGGFAEVWKIKDTATSKQYVLKHIRIKPHLKDADKEKLIERIKNEASVKIPSPYIVKSFGLVSLSPIDYVIVFEYIKGDVLDNWIKKHMTLDWRDRKKLFIEILKGVGDAHSVNVIHRDLKPQNILVREDDATPIIFDFGISKFKDKNITLTGEIMGSMPYMDPSAFLSGAKYVDGQCDIYALGIILYELAMGNHPWAINKIIFEDFVKHISSGKKNIMEIDTKFSFTEDETVRDVVKKATMFDVGSRIKTTDEMIALLGELPKEKPKIAVDFEKSTPILKVESSTDTLMSMMVLSIENGSTLTLGRLQLDASNDSISKKHATLIREDNTYYIYDCGSKNGTYVNGLKIKENIENKIEIRHADRIRFADLWTRFVFLNIH